MVALAGTVAEETWSRRWTEYDSWWVEIFRDPDSMSPKDWAGAGCKPGHPDRALIRAADEVWSLLEPRDGVLWEPLVRSSRRLMQAHRIGPEQMHAVPRRQTRPRSARGTSLPG